MKADIWMPLYVADYLADTGRLTTEQHGAYLLLIMDYWRNGAPVDDNEELAQITKMTPNAWSNARAKLVRFFTIKDGYWIHDRVEREIINARNQKTIAKERAVKGAAARWGKNSIAPSNTTSNAPSIQQAIQNDAPSPSPSPSPSKSKAPTTSKKSSIYSPNFIVFWESYPNKTGKDAAWKLWLKISPPLQEILDALIWQKKSERWMTGYIPHPSTYLNQGRWKDEPEKPHGRDIEAEIRAFCDEGKTIEGEFHVA